MAGNDPQAVVILRQAAPSRRRPGDPAARESATLPGEPLFAIACLNRSPSVPLGPPVSLRSPEDDESKTRKKAAPVFPGAALDLSGLAFA